MLLYLPEQLKIVKNYLACCIFQHASKSGLIFRFGLVQEGELQRLLQWLCCFFYLNKSGLDYQGRLKRLLFSLYSCHHRCIPATLPKLNGGGLVVNISSDAAISAYPQWGAYSASKAALDRMSLIFDNEMNQDGVNFIAVDPGDMRTPMHFEAIPDADPGALIDPKDSAAKLMQSILHNKIEGRVKLWDQ